MGSLTAFLAGNAEKTPNVKLVVSERFKDENGNPVEWEIKCINTAEDERLRKSSNKRVPVVGKKGQYTEEMDWDLYLGKLAAACTVYPDLADAELQISYHTEGEANTLKAMLKPGEYTYFVQRVQELNGFTESFDDKVEEVKNV